MATDNSETIQTNSTKPKRVTVDGNSAEQHSIADQIMADKYAASRDAQSTPRRGVLFSRMKPGGTVN